MHSAGPRIVAGWLALASALAACSPAAAQLRIVSYNTLTGENPGIQTAQPAHSTVLQAIGEQSVNGIARPIDVLLLQEQFNTSITTASFAAALNTIYGTNRYVASTLDASTSDPERRAGGPAMVYNSETVEKIAPEVRFGSVNGSAQARSTMRYQFRPKDYGSNADFWAYSNHYKAGSTSSDMARRQVEALGVHNSANALGEGAHIIFAGDYNIQSSGEQMYQTLLSAGAGQAVDPLNASGTPGSPVTWLDNAAYRGIHTQNPRGPMDDRFDFQLVSGEMQDGEGMSIITGSYRAFANNNTHSLNGNISTGTGASSTVLTALRDASDHLPVVVDYQLPSRLGVEVAAIPSMITLGASVSIGVSVANLAPSLLAIGADELDYTLSVSGSLFGGAMGTDPAAGLGNLHQIMLDTATAGMKSGVITVAATSQGADDALFTLPVSFQVVGAFDPADFNQDGVVDGGDLANWGHGLGAAGNATSDMGDADADGDVDGADFLTWQQSFAGAAETPATSIPEPATIALVAMAAAAMFLIRK